MSKGTSFRLLAMLLLLLFAKEVRSQSPDLVSAAKREGKVVIYGSLESDTTDAIKEQFQQQTGIQAEYWRASATKVMDRALSEFRAGKPVCDVILTNDNPMEIMFRQGVLAKYDSPTAKEYPKHAIDPNLGPRYRNVVIGILYNKDGVKPVDAPKTLEDLVKPQYKGKVVMPDPTQHTTTTQWVASLSKVLGNKEKADKFIHDLAATQPILVESLLPAAERVTTGETPIAITYVKYAYIFGQKGAPLDYVRLDKMMGDGHYIALEKQAPHINAGKAFIDYFLGEQSMKLMAKRGEFVNRKGVYPPLPGADKIQFVQMVHLSTKEFAAKKKEYKQIFLH